MYSYFQHEVEGSNGGFCQRFSENGVGPINDESFRMIAYLISFCMLAWWVRGQYLGNTSGFYSSHDRIIFPIHMKVLAVLAASMFFEALFSMLYDLKPFGTTNNITLSIISILCVGLSSSLLGINQFDSFLILIFVL
jgi:hypothetical protein